MPTRSSGTRPRGTLAGPRTPVDRSTLASSPFPSVSIAPGDSAFTVMPSRPRPGQRPGQADQRGLAGHDDGPDGPPSRTVAEATFTIRPQPRAAIPALSACGSSIGRVTLPRRSPATRPAAARRCRLRRARGVVDQMSTAPAGRRGRTAAGSARSASSGMVLAPSAAHRAATPAASASAARLVDQQGTAGRRQADRQRRADAVPRTGDQIARGPSGKPTTRLRVTRRLSGRLALVRGRMHCSFSAILRAVHDDGSRTGTASPTSRAGQPDQDGGICRTRARRRPPGRSVGGWSGCPGRWAGARPGPARRGCSPSTARPSPMSGM